MLKHFLSSLLIIFFVCSTGKLIAQVSGHPNHIDWKYISTPYANIIYPKGKYAEAKRISAYVDRMNGEGTFSNNRENKKIDIILQTQQVQANGYVGIGPYRSEFYATPPQGTNGLHNNNWLDVLAIHEYRHVQQLNNTRVGVTNIAYKLLGQAGWAGLEFFAVPNWFAEGDAVLAETKFSTNGRGRLPSFLARTKALLLDDKMPSYTKVRGGSFRKVWPNHYNYGYTMTNYVDQNFSPDTWRNIITESAKYKSKFYPFNGALKRHTKMGVRDLYAATNETLKRQFRYNQSVAERKQLKYTKISESKNVPIFHSFPVFYKGNLLWLESSYNQIDRVVQLNADGKKEDLTNVGIQLEDYLSINGSTLAWTEYSKHPRWDFENYSDVFLYNLDTKEKKQLTTKGKYFSPQANSNASQVVCVHIPDQNNSSLTFMEVGDGFVTKQTKALHNGVVSFPKYIDDQRIAYLERKDGYAYLCEYNLSTDKHTKLIGPTLATMNELTVAKTSLYFTASFDGTDQIYKLNLENGLIEKLSNELIGAYTPAADGNGKLAFHTITAEGTDLILTDESLASPYTPSDEVFISSLPYPTINNDIIDDDLALKEHKENNYNKLGRMQLHSYALIPSASTPSFALYFENALSNIAGVANLGYNLNEKGLSTDANFNLSSGYPVFSLNTIYNQRSVSVDPKEPNFDFDEWSNQLAMSLPLSWIKGNYINNVRPAVGLGYRLINTLQEIENFGNGSDVVVNFSASSLKRIARQNIGRRAGAAFEVGYRKTLSGASGQRYRAESSLYFPGLSKNHAIKLSAEYLNENNKNVYQFSDIFSYARGSRPSFKNDQFSRLSIDYALPLLYPEFGLFDITYFKRISLNLFADATKLSLPESSRNISAVGTELYFDNVYFNFIPLTLGYRFSFIQEKGQASYVGNQLLLGMNF